MPLQINKDPQILALIDAVRLNDILYDYRQSQYNDEARKERIWAEVAQECRMETADAKTLWRKLYYFFMNCYRNELVRLVRAHYDEAAVGPLPHETPPIPVMDQHVDQDSGTWSYYSDMRFVAMFRDKSSDPELERLIQLAKPLVMRTGPAKRAVRERLIRKWATVNTNGLTTSTDSAAAKDTSNTKSTDKAIPSNTISRNDNSSQTTMESLHFDIPPINEEELSAQDVCLQSFFDAMFRDTRSLPTPLQRKIKREFLQTLHKAQLMAGEETMVNNTNE